MMLENISSSPPEVELNLFTNEFLSNLVFTKPILILDLDETLIFSTRLPPSNEHFKIRIGRNIIYIQTRPGLNEFLQKIEKNYEIFFFTASTKDYANKIIDHISPNTDQSHRLFKENCSFYKGYYVKDLRIIDRPLSKSILIDDLSSSGLFQPKNMIKIRPFDGNNNDNTLLNELFPLLESFYYESDFSENLFNQLQKIKFINLSTF